MDSDKDIFIRNLTLDSCDTCLTFLQKKIGDVSCVIWDAALVLAKYLDKTSQKNKWLKGKRVLELGAGLGCAGIVAACFGAHVVLTDLATVLPMLEKNIKANEKQWKSLGGVAEAQVLEWGKEVNNLNFKPEIILLTDCVYYEESVKPLLDTMEVFFNNEGTYAILSQEERDTPKQVSVWKEFITKLNERFKVEKIPMAEQHSTYSSPDIHLMKISKK
ncbi:protein-lysine methyltransferase METTL21D [Nasonia vitripennis]|uniref:Uncharacterized protein n=1 Tax=Nasonia vitripennis TaxID=7425 RepID=A0A7M7LJE7_NASVI|nr:protein-lysine methyltransferase METTL21D [Nasonia vitripennis]